MVAIFFHQLLPRPPTHNRALLNISQILKAIISSVVDMELVVVFINAREAVVKQIILTELGHPHPHTTFITDNTTAEGAINHTIQPKKTKAMDMHLH